MNWITVFTHKRPECLYLCLESLVNCRRIEDYSIYLASNEDSSPEIRSIAKELLVGLNYEIGIRPVGWLANRANGEAIKAGIARSDTFTVTIGEDETVAKDFLEMIEVVATLNTDEKLFSISGSGLTVHNVPKELDRAEWLIRVDSFYGLGCAIFKAPFEKYMKPYYCEDYYKGEARLKGNSMHDVGWMVTNFPEMSTELHNKAGYTIDALTHRVMLRNGLYSLIALEPRSHEIGFYGAHVSSDPEIYKKMFENKTLQEKVTIMRELISSGKIKDLFGNWSLNYRDLQDDHTWTELKVKDSTFDRNEWRIIVWNDVIQKIE